ACGVVLVACLGGRRSGGAGAAFAGAVMLCLSARFVYVGRMLTMDSLLCLWVVLSWAAAHMPMQPPVLKWRWWLLSAGACGLGLLPKGPAALVLIAVPILGDRRLAPLSSPPGVGCRTAYPRR